MESQLAIGIDLGTTFSGASVYRKGKCEIIPNKEGHRLTPSLVYYHPNSLEVSVGTTAYDLGPRNFGNFIFDIKRIIGRKFDDAYVQKLKESQEYGYNIVRGENDKAEVRVLYDGVTVNKTPEQISSEIIKYLKESASEYLGGEVKEAVISVPAYFSNSQRKATRAAGEMAGLKVLKLLSEPVAAAIHYAEDRLEKESTLIVFDFGGGTLDASIIKVDGKTFAVKSVEGDSYLGGRDFDQMLLRHFKSAIIGNFGQSVFNNLLLRRVKKSCTRLKIKLSTDQRYSLPIYCIGGVDGRDFTLSMTRAEFEQLGQELFHRAKYLVDRCLSEAGMTKEDISDVVLVGGTTRIPKIREILKSYFGTTKLRMDLNPDEAVALGAGIQAAVLKQKLQELEKYKVTEVTPLSLGLSLEGDLMEMFIEKNSPIPIKSKPMILYTVENNQTSAVFPIFEGERKNCKFNNKLGEFKIQNLPPGKAEEVEFSTVFTLNEDGILEVESYVVSTGKGNKLIMTMGEFRLCDYKIRRTLDDADQNKKEDEIFENFTLYMYGVQRICKHVMYDLNKIKSHVDRSFVKTKCEQFLAAIKNFDYKEIDSMQREYKLFKDAIIGIVQNVMEINFAVRPQEESVSGQVVKLSSKFGIWSFK